MPDQATFCKRIRPETVRSLCAHVLQVHELLAGFLGNDALGPYGFHSAIRSEQAVTITVSNPASFEAFPIHAALLLNLPSGCKRQYPKTLNG
jgi:hypothetical protein